MGIYKLPFLKDVYNNARHSVSIYSVAVTIICQRNNKRCLLSFYRLITNNQIDIVVYDVLVFETKVLDRENRHPETFNCVFFLTEL